MLAIAPPLTLTPRAPFDASSILGYLSRSPLEPLDVVTDGAYRRAVRLGGRPVLLEAAPGGTVDAPTVTVRVLATGAPLGNGSGPAADASEENAGALDEAATLALAADAVGRWWRVEQDPSELDAIAARDPIFGALLARLHGARAPLMPSPFECLVWAILGQQITRGVRLQDEAGAGRAVRHVAGVRRPHLLAVSGCGAPRRGRPGRPARDPVQPPEE